MLFMSKRVPRSSLIAVRSSVVRTSLFRFCAADRMMLPGQADLPLLRSEQVLVGFLRPLGSVGVIQQIAQTGVISFAEELMPRTTRAQSMDALSSMGTICGYKAVLIAAGTLAQNLPYANDRRRLPSPRRASW